jgi:hypothetical protein
LNCSVIVAKEGKNKNITVDGPAVWMYEKCLALDECARGVLCLLLTIIKPSSRSFVPVLEKQSIGPYMVIK